MDFFILAVGPPDIGRIFAYFFAHVIIMCAPGLLHTTSSTIGYLVLSNKPMEAGSNEARQKKPK